MTPWLDSIRVERLHVPLVKPYRLAFGPVTGYDTLLVELIDRDGRRGWGEATLLTGYTDETIDGAWTLASNLAPQLLRCTREQFAARCVAEGQGAPFTATAFMTASEMLSASTHLKLRQTGQAGNMTGHARVPILGLLNATERGAVRDEAAALLARGYRTFKVKVGFDVDDDIRNVATIQSEVAGRAAIRLDANQGYSAADACRFLAALDPAGIELFEQPCAAGDWASHAAAVRVARVPMMLDESIYGLADIERAARERQADYVKVKLMKFVSLAALSDAIALIRARGMKPVLGNGVANDLGCWMEACIAADSIDNAGEMNGFLKPVGQFFAEPLGFADGHIELPGMQPVIDEAALQRFRVAACHARQPAMH